MENIIEEMDNQSGTKRKCYQKLLNETQQTPKTRQKIIEKIEEQLDKTILTFFTSFKFPVTIEDADAVIIEEVLQNTEFGRGGFALVLNSAGGSGLAAERIINICRAYSKNNFTVIIPNMAKSAATMISFGSDKIFMSATSELGPIDPQIRIPEGDTYKVYSVHNIIRSYEQLFNDAVRSNGRLEPFLQQLDRYDARDIEEFKRAMELSESIAVKNLKKGMMKRYSEKTIKIKIKPFLTPLKTKSHGRPIFIDEAKKCGLTIESIDINSELWCDIWELYIRSNYLMNIDCAKLIESKNDNYYASISIIEK